DTFRREIREQVGNVAPAIKEANERYTEKMDLLDEIDNVLKTDPKFYGREGVRKTAENLGRIFNSGKQFTREASEELERELGIDILGTIAGQQLSDVAPRATSRIGGALDAVVQPVASVAARNLVPLAGATKQQVIDRISKIPGVSPSARAAIVNTVAQL